MKTYQDGIQDAIDLLRVLSENSTDYIIDRLTDYQYADRDAPSKPALRVYGWVWKDKLHEDCFYVPSYTPAQHVERGELLALVDPADLHSPLENTKWY
jgi:hypothetical protein